MSEPVHLHAGLVAIGGRGVLITGPSGSGKSSLAVSLLRAAAREGMAAALVADDRTVIERRGGTLVGAPAAPIAGLIELAGIGLLRLSTLGEAPIALAADLRETRERLPEREALDLFGLDVPRVGLPARQAPFAADLVLTLLAAGTQALVKT